MPAARATHLVALVEEHAHRGHADLASEQNVLAGLQRTK